MRGSRRRTRDTCHHRNPGGNPVIFDTLLLEKVIEEPNITLLLNTVVMDMEKQGDRISSVQAFCSQNSTLYRVAAPLYCDASGDGVLGFLSGAAYRMGAESAEELPTRSSIRPGSTIQVCRSGDQ